jgi:hypothetical protein
MAQLSESKLKVFAGKEHKKFKRRAAIEFSVALLPLAALITGFSIIYTRPNSGELMAPARLGIASLLFPLIITAYIVFLVFVVRDVRKKIKQK